jgi:hypothetical protein
MFPLPVHIYFQILAFITSVICWPKIRSSRFRWFLPFLILMVIVELTSRYLTHEIKMKTNGMIYNFSIPLEYLFYLWLFLKVYRIPRLKLFCLVYIYCYAIFCGIVLLFGGVKSFNSIILSISNVSGILFSCIYFYEQIISDLRTNLLKEPMFWISCGVLLFNLGEFIYSLFYKLLREYGWDQGTKLFKLINNQLVLILYSCIIIGLICVKNCKDYIRISKT